MAEIVTLAGPLEPRLRQAVADLYGKADAKYRRPEILDHVFAQSPAGPALHSFAMDGDRPVGHCAVVPMPARHGSEPLRAGKLEALWLEESYRGRQPGQEPVVVALLARLYEFADERGIELIHAYATPPIGRIIGFQPLQHVGERSLVALVGRHPVARAQRVLRALGNVVSPAQTRTGLRRAEVEDADLVEAPLPPPGRWTTVADDAWEWYRASPLVHVLDVHGTSGSRALVQLPGKAGEPVRLIGWRPRARGLAPGVALLRALADLASDRAAGTIRFQPWTSAAGDGALARACRLLGFVRRHDLTTLWVRSGDAELARAESIVPTPLFYLGF